MRVVAILATCFLVALTTWGEELPTCAVLTFETGEGTSELRARRFSDRFAKALERTGRFRLLPRAEAMTQLQAANFEYVRGCAEARCAIRAGQLLKVDKVIAGMIDRRNGQVSAYSIMVDVPTETVEQRDTTRSVLSLDHALRELAEQSPLALTFSHNDWTAPLPLDRDVRLVWIPAGEFFMGSTRAERRWAAGEEGLGKEAWFTSEGTDPQHVAVDYWYWLGRTEVTVGQWAEFIKATGYVTDGEKQDQIWGWNWETGDWDWLSGHGWWNPNFDTAPADHDPVTSVSWNDATAFCEWLTRKERDAGRLPDGYHYRLPTEVEWEYACRGGNAATRFWWGDSLVDGEQRLNAAGLDGGTEGVTWEKAFPWRDGYVFVSPVDTYGQLGRNGFDLADMLGNVWEWCLDSFHESSAQVQTYTGDADRRVVRGGAYNRAPGMARCAFRTWNCPSLAYAYFGFRICLGPIRSAGPVRDDEPIKVRSR